VQAEKSKPDRVGHVAAGVGRPIQVRVLGVDQPSPLSLRHAARPGSCVDHNDSRADTLPQVFVPPPDGHVLRGVEVSSDPRNRGVFYYHLVDAAAVSPIVDLL